MIGLSLSVVIIGKNEEKNIVRCIESIKNALNKYLDYEISYVDSDSTDRTIEYVMNYDIAIYKIRCDQTMSPSKGRYIGAINSKKDYILFLDGDMELISGWLEEAIGIIASKANIAGIFGIRNDFIISGDEIVDKRINCYHTSELKPTKHFGGAVLFKRSDLMSAGNYAPNIIANEEAELHSRLLKNRRTILEHPKDMINHYIALDKIQKNAKTVLFSKRKLGLGQGFVNSIYQRSLLYFIIRFKYFFISLVFDITSILLLLCIIRKFSYSIIIIIVSLQVMSLIMNTVFRRWYYYLLDKVNFLFLLPGIVSYENQSNVHYDKIN